MRNPELNPLYQPYRGGAGPSEDQVHGNNLALQHELTLLGINSVLVKIRISGVEIEMVEFRIGGYFYKVGYDRWGYHSDDGKKLFDQDRLSTVIDWVKRQKEHSQQRL